MASEEEAFYYFLCPFHIRTIVSISGVPGDLLELTVLEPENLASGCRR